MGKTDKVKDKVAAKVAKAKAKVAAKCGKCAAVALALLALGGCATSDSAQPAKSQTQNNTFDDCIIIVATQCSISNRVVRANGTRDMPMVDLFGQTQSLESSGTESYAQTATQTPTTDVKPDVDVKYNDALAAASTTSKSVLDQLTDLSREAVLKLMSSKESGTVQVTKTDGTTATVECKDGQCAFKDCSDGSCSPTAANCANGACAPKN